MSANLESLIQEHAGMMAQQTAEVTKWANSEEDVRYECNKLIDTFLKKTGLQVKGQHEYGLAGDRIDSKYGEVIIEYKDPKGAGKITGKKNAAVGESWEEWEIPREPEENWPKTF